jgi:hypothetical protein
VLNVLNLVLYSPGPEYDEMYRITREYYSQTGIDTVYYCFDDSINENYAYDPVTKLLRIRGKESYLPGILQKTVKAFQFVPQLGKSYDYIARTNISTIVDFRKWLDILSTHPVDYAGSTEMSIAKGWRDPPAGITDDRYAGTRYASGTCILFSQHLFGAMLQKLDQIDYGVIDDVAIGKFVAEQFPHVKLQSFGKYMLYTEHVSADWVCSRKHHYIFFRNRHTNRADDVKMMRAIVNCLTK